jgi:hypothetical protein
VLDSLQRLRALHKRQQELWHTYRELEYSAPFIHHLVRALLTCPQSVHAAWIFACESARCIPQAAEGLVRMHTEVCEGLRMQAEVPDASRVFVDVGLGFSVECEGEDVRRIAQLRQAAAMVLPAFCSYAACAHTACTC